MLGDPIAFRRILENLVANAVDSLESKPGRVTISTAVVQRDGEPAIRMTVADTGRGMTTEEAGKIFNDFYTTKEGGTGLGLSIVRRLVMDVQGTHRRRERAGHGDAHHHRDSGRQVAGDLKFTMQNARCESHEGVTRTRGTMTQILVVDDVPAMAEQYAYDLQRVGKYDAIVAGGGDEALDVLGREPIDCVVLDLEMPGTDGFEVLRRLRQRGIDDAGHRLHRHRQLRTLRAGGAARRVRIHRQGRAGRAPRAGDRERGLARAAGHRAAVAALAVRRRDARSSATARRCARCATRSRAWRRFRAAC